MCLILIFQHSLYQMINPISIPVLPQTGGGTRGTTGGKASKLPGKV